MGRHCLGKETVIFIFMVLHFDIKTSSFKERVLSAVKGIPRGGVLTYKDIARLAGSIRAFRAVGNILNKNYNPDIPCHRVIRSDGRAGGYNRGKKKKLFILSQEGIKIQ